MPARHAPKPRPPLGHNRDRVVRQPPAQERPAPLNNRPPRTGWLATLPATTHVLLRMDRRDPVPACPFVHSRLRQRFTTSGRLRTSADVAPSGAGTVCHWPRGRPRPSNRAQEERMHGSPPCPPHRASPLQSSETRPPHDGVAAAPCTWPYDAGTHANPASTPAVIGPTGNAASSLMDTKDRPEGTKRAKCPRDRRSRIPGRCLCRHTLLI